VAPKVTGWFDGVLSRSDGVVKLPRMNPSSKPSLQPLARQLRIALTPAEARLWKYLQNRQLAGRKFRRQHSVGPYILDFYCPREHLAVELDGAAHDHERAAQRDEARTRYLESQDIKVVRFENRDVMSNLEGVLQAIKDCFAVR
jgi:very-short-patch-repair endonuclease